MINVIKKDVELGQRTKTVHLIFVQPIQDMLHHKKEARSYCKLF